MLILSFLLLLKIIITADTCNSNNNNNCFPNNIKYKRTQYGNQTINRPIFHFTPKQGWMNDPNGLFYDGTNYHIYYQYNPSNTIWDLPLYWGHAVFKNGFTSWEHKPIAIQPTDKISGTYTGSIYIDDDNLSQQFDNIESNNRIIAMWTMTYENWTEHQYLSLSFDSGDTFVTPDYVNYNNTSLKVNPVVDKPKGEDDKESLNFRDPQVIKYSKSLYIMSVAKSLEYAIYFYSSKNALQFKYAGQFGMAGYLGLQYECPNLAYLKNNDKEDNPIEESQYWVLFISISPGTLQGCSSTQYFIGELKVSESSISFQYIENGYTSFLDLGKDFYAMQIFYEPPLNIEQSTNIYLAKDYVTTITWASNWQYAYSIPTDPWRTSMTLPRQIKIGHYSISDKKLLYIFSRPCIDLNKLDSPGWKPKEEEDGQNIKSGYTLDLSEGAYGALEFVFEFTFVDDAFTNDDPAVITLYLYGLSIPEEYLRIGFNTRHKSFFIDRGHSNVQFVHDNPFFTDKLSLNVNGIKTDSTTSLTKQRTKYINSTNTLNYEETITFFQYRYKITVHGIIDRNIIELFFNEEKDDENDDFGWSALTSTNTFFFTGGNFIGNLKVEYNDPSLVNGKVIETNEGFNNVNLKARQLYKSSE